MKAKRYKQKSPFKDPRVTHLQQDKPLYHNHKSKVICELCQPRKYAQYLNQMSHSPSRSGATSENGNLPQLANQNSSHQMARAYKQEGTASRGDPQFLDPKSLVNPQATSMRSQSNLTTNRKMGTIEDMDKMRSHSSLATPGERFTQGAQGQKYQQPSSHSSKFKNQRLSHKHPVHQKQFFEDHHDERYAQDPSYQNPHGRVGPLQPLGGLSSQAQSQLLIHHQNSMESKDDGKVVEGTTTTLMGTIQIPMYQGQAPNGFPIVLGPNQGSATISHDGPSARGLLPSAQQQQMNNATLILHSHNSNLIKSGSSHQKFTNSADRDGSYDPRYGGRLSHLGYTGYTGPNSSVITSQSGKAHQKSNGSSKMRKPKPMVVQPIEHRMKAASKRKMKKLKHQSLGHSLNHNKVISVEQSNSQASKFMNPNKKYIFYSSKDSSEVFPKGTTTSLSKPLDITESMNGKQLIEVPTRKVPAEFINGPQTQYTTYQPDHPSYYHTQNPATALVSEMRAQTIDINSSSHRVHSKSNIDQYPSVRYPKGPHQQQNYMGSSIMTSHRESDQVIRHSVGDSEIIGQARNSSAEMLKQAYQVETFARNSKNFDEGVGSSSQNRYSENGNGGRSKIPIYVAEPADSKVPTTEVSDMMNPGSTYPITHQSPAYQAVPSSTAEAMFEKKIEKAEIPQQLKVSSEDASRFGNTKMVSEGVSNGIIPYQTQQDFKGADRLLQDASQEESSSTVIQAMNVVVKQEQPNIPAPSAHTSFNFGSQGQVPIDPAARTTPGMRKSGGSLGSSMIDRADTLGKSKFQQEASRPLQPSQNNPSDFASTSENKPQQPIKAPVKSISNMTKQQSFASKASRTSEELQYLNSDPFHFQNQSLKEVKELRESKERELAAEITKAQRQPPPPEVKMEKKKSIQKARPPAKLDSLKRRASDSLGGNMAEGARVGKGMQVVQQEQSSLKPKKQASIETRQQIKSSVKKVAIEESSKSRKRRELNSTGSHQPPIKSHKTFDSRNEIKEAFNQSFSKQSQQQNNGKSRTITEQHLSSQKAKQQAIQHQRDEKSLSGYNKALAKTIQPRAEYNLQSESFGQKSHIEDITKKGTKTSAGQFPTIVKQSQTVIIREKDSEPVKPQISGTFHHSNTYFGGQSVIPQQHNRMSSFGPDTGSMEERKSAEGDPNKQQKQGGVPRGMTIIGSEQFSVENLPYPGAADSEYSLSQLQAPSNIPSAAAPPIPSEYNELKTKKSQSQILTARKSTLLDKTEMTEQQQKQEEVKKQMKDRGVSHKKSISLAKSPYQPYNNQLLPNLRKQNEPSTEKQKPRAIGGSAEKSSDYQGLPLPSHLKKVREPFHIRAMANGEILPNISQASSAQTLPSAMVAKVEGSNLSPEQEEGSYFHDRSQYQNYVNKSFVPTRLFRKNECSVERLEGSGMEIQSKRKVNKSLQTIDYIGESTNDAAQGSSRAPGNKQTRDNTTSFQSLPHITETPVLIKKKQPNLGQRDGADYDGVESSKASNFPSNFGIGGGGSLQRAGFLLEQSQDRGSMQMIHIQNSSTSFEPHREASADSQANKVNGIGTSTNIRINGGSMFSVNSNQTIQNHALGSEGELQHVQRLESTNPTGGAQLAPMGAFDPSNSLNFPHISSKAQLSSTEENIAEIYETNERKSSQNSLKQVQPAPNIEPVNDYTPVPPIGRKLGGRNSQKMYYEHGSSGEVNLQSETIQRLNQQQQLEPRGRQRNQSEEPITHPSRSLKWQSISSGDLPPSARDPSISAGNVQNPPKRVGSLQQRQFEAAMGRNESSLEVVRTSSTKTKAIVSSSEKHQPVHNQREPATEEAEREGEYEGEEWEDYYEEAYATNPGQGVPGGYNTGFESGFAKGYAQARAEVQTISAGGEDQSNNIVSRGEDRQSSSVYLRNDVDSNKEVPIPSDNPNISQETEKMLLSSAGDGRPKKAKKTKTKGNTVSDFNSVPPPGKMTAPQTGDPHRNMIKIDDQLEQIVTPLGSNLEPQLLTQPDLSRANSRGRLIQESIDFVRSVLEDGYVYIDPSWSHEHSHEDLLFDKALTIVENPDALWRSSQATFPQQSKDTRRLYFRFQVNFKEGKSECKYFGIAPPLTAAQLAKGNSVNKVGIYLGSGSQVGEKGSQKGLFFNINGKETPLTADAGEQPTLASGDIIGVRLDQRLGAVYFDLNNRDLGLAYQGKQLSSCLMLPTIDIGIGKDKVKLLKPPKNLCDEVDWVDGAKVLGSKTLKNLRRLEILDKGVRFLADDSRVDSSQIAVFRVIANFMVNQNCKVADTLQLFDYGLAKDRQQQLGAARIFNELSIDQILNPSSFASSHLAFTEAVRLQEEALSEIITLQGLLSVQQEFSALSSTTPGLPTSSETRVLSGLVLEKVLAFPLSQEVYNEFDGDIEKELGNIATPFYDRFEFLLQVKLYQIQQYLEAMDPLKFDEIYFQTAPASNPPSTTATSKAVPTEVDRFTQITSALMKSCSLALQELRARFEAEEEPRPQDIKNFSQFLMSLGADKNNSK